MPEVPEVPDPAGAQQERQVPQVQREQRVLSEQREPEVPRVSCSEQAHWSIPHTRAYVSKASGSADNKRIRADTTLCDQDHMYGNRIHSSSTHICSGMSDCTPYILQRDKDLQHRCSEPRVLQVLAAAGPEQAEQLQQVLREQRVLREQEQLLPEL